MLWSYLDSIKMLMCQVQDLIQTDDFLEVVEGLAIINFSKFEIMFMQ